MPETRMPRVSAARLAAITFGPTLILVLFAILTGWGVMRQRRGEEAVTLSESIRTTLAQLVRDVTDGETGQRGYLLTGNTSYLEPYAQAHNRAAQRAAQLRALTLDPGQVARADSIQSLIGAKFDELAETINVYDTRGRDAALAIVGTNRGKARMDQIRAVADHLEAREDELLSERSDQEEKFRRALLIILVAGTAGSVVLSLLLNGLVSRYSAWLARTNTSLEDANNQLSEQQAELETQNEQLEEQATELMAQSKTLEEQAVELEMQNEKLQETGVELEERTEAAEAANVAKSRFLASMSHDLRTPLNAIMGYSDLLESGAGQRGPVSEVQKRDLERIRSSSRHLLALINDILAYAQVDAGKVSLELRSHPLEPIIHDAEASFMPQLSVRKLRYTYTPADQPLHVLADADKLVQVLLNLVTNAIKFTEPGGHITVACTTDRSAVLVQVRDTGRGIPEAELASIFEPFAQVERERTDAAHQGVGLGLAICRQLTRAMGGDVLVESRVGVGSTFTVRVRGAQHEAAQSGRA